MCAPVRQYGCARIFYGPTYRQGRLTENRIASLLNKDRDLVLMRQESFAAFVVQFDNIISGIDTVIGHDLWAALPKSFDNLGCLRPRSTRRTRRKSSIGSTCGTLHRPGIAVCDIYPRLILIARCRGRRRSRSLLR